MSVIPAHELGGAADAAPKPESFWQGLSRAIDAYLADRTKKVIPAITLRRSRREIALMMRLPLFIPLAAAANMLLSAYGHSCP